MSIMPPGSDRKTSHSPDTCAAYDHPLVYDSPDGHWTCDCGQSIGPAIKALLDCPSEIAS